MYVFPLFWMKNFVYGFIFDLQGKKVSYFLDDIVFLFIVAAPNAFEVSEGALPILLFFLDVCPSVFDFSCNLSLVPSTELL